MKSPARWAVLLSMLLAGNAFAHDPLQSTVDGRLRAEGLELTVTMSRSAAVLLLDHESTGIAGELKDLEKGAAQLCTLSTKEGPLKLRDAVAKLTPENDVEFRLFYPRPPSGKLELGLPYLKRMQEGHCATLIVSDEADRALAVHDIWPGDGPREIPIPPPH